MILAQRQKYRLMERNRDPEINSRPMDSLCLAMEERIYNGAKTASLINSAGKTGQLHVKE